MTKHTVGDWVTHTSGLTGVVEYTTERYGLVQYHVRGKNGWKNHQVTDRDNTFLPFHTVHAHVEKETTDCDGRHTIRWVSEMNEVERKEEFGDLALKDRVMCWIVSMHADSGMLSVNRGGITWHEDTEEGYVHTDVSWCEKPDCVEGVEHRDHYAEQRGY